MGSEYIIIGDTEQFKDCLVCVCGSSFKHANETLYRMLNNPTEHDKKMMAGHKNFKINEVSEENCWWNYGCD